MNAETSTKTTRRTITGRVARALVANPIKAFIAGLLIVIACAAGLPRAHVDNDYRAFFDDRQSYLEVSDWLNDRLGYGNDIAMIVYSPENGDVFNDLSIMQVDEIVSRVAEFENVESASSWIDQLKLVVDNTGHAYSAGMLSGLNIFDEADRAILKADAEATPTIMTRFIGRNEKTAAIVLFLDTDSSDPDRIEKLDALKKNIDGLRTDLQSVVPGDDIKFVGASLFDFQAQHVLRNDLRVLMPISFALIFGVMWYLFHSPRFAAAGLFLVGLPTLATAGLLSTAGVVFNALAVSGLLLVGTLAVADILHIASSYFMEKAKGSSTEDALTSALELNAWAVFATSLTTALGQLALLNSASPPIRVMGITVITGVWLALLIAFLMLPLILKSMKGASSPRLLSLANIMSRVTLFSARHAGIVTLVSVAIFAVSILSLSQAKLTDSLGGWFSKDTEFRTGMDIVSEDYVGPDALTIAVEATTRDQLDARKFPQSAYLPDLYTGLQSTLEDQGISGDWFTPVTAVQATRDRLESSEKTSFRARDDMQQTADNFSGEDLAASGLMTPLSFGSKDYTLWKFDPATSSSFNLLEYARTFETATRGAVEDRDIRVGGLSVAFANLSVENFHGIVISSSFAFLLITLTMFFVLRSVRLGFAAIAPNIFPIFITLGVWAFLNGKVNLAVATVFSVSMGLVVDDTIHILAKYKHYREEGYDVFGALEAAVQFSGPGLASTTLVISCGFFLLGTSDFLLTAQKALLVAVTLVNALVFDIVVLPALVVLFERVGGGRKRGIS